MLTTPTKQDLLLVVSVNISLTHDAKLVSKNKTHTDCGTKK